MPAKVTLDTVFEIGLALPNAERSTTFGASCLKVNGRMFACPALHRSAEPNSLVIRINLEDREQLIAEDPKTYYVTEHYIDYPSVLVRLSNITPDALRDLLRMAWRFVSANAKQPVRRKARPQKKRQ